MGFDFCNGFNCLHGKNGVGKTNVLDALHFICNGKSYFSRIDSQHIRFGEDFALLEAVLQNRDEETTINLGLQRDGKKSIRKNGVMVRRLTDYVGYLPAVIITPGDITLLTGNPDERRRFMDRTIGFSDPGYLKELVKHNKLLDHRNGLLKQFYERQYHDSVALEAIDHQLTPLLDSIHKAREKFLNDILGFLDPVYTALVGAKEELAIDYSSDLNDSSGTDVLHDGIRADLAAHRTTKGIHKDDLEVRVNGVSLKKFGSQGQIKSATIALNLAAYLYIAEQTGSTPLLLLDDIFEKIDDDRALRMLQLISGEDFGQIFITDTSEERLRTKLEDVGSEKKFFNIERD